MMKQSAIAAAAAFSLLGPMLAQASPLGIAHGLDSQDRVLVHADGMPADDAFMTLGALTVKGRLMRDSELGHDDYRPELADDPMRQIGETWLGLLDTVHGKLVDEGRMRAQAGRDDEADPAAYADAAYLYHMHHSGGRFEHLGLYDQVTHNPAPLMSALADHLVNERYADGEVAAANDSDTDALAFGLDALHGPAYAWVRQHKPGGEDDMGQLELQTLAGWLGHSRDDMVEIARAMADTADAAWDDDAGMFVRDQGAEWSVDQVGALLRGLKGVYETLYLFGDADDQARAETLADRTASITRAIVAEDGPIRDWGLPARIAFEDGEARAASDHVDVAAQWRFVHQVTGGFSLLREREGTAKLLSERAPELEEEMGAAIDRLFKGALEYQLDSAIVPTRLAYEDGSVADPTVTTRSVAAFMMAVANGYRTGEAFDRPGSWGDDEALAERSRALYDAFLDHGEVLTEQLIVRD
ncbi:hypothetical protein [Thioalkalivibrio thiocyanoxidans]|uniref:hypothetical protein n=1 Tax=Thioalkalivibrio thiocyanoxidans TaxID=152475 RepID=UPI0003715CDB|nr:hypothetical protein [Thioalkalivibrio thiocyanoxidans]